MLATRQLIQAAVVHMLDATWIGEEPQRSAWSPWIPWIPVALLRAAALLAGFGSMYFAITAITQESYRREFFEPVIEDVERNLAVRAVYLGLRESRPSPRSTAIETD